MPLKRRAAPRAEIMLWDGSAWQKALAESAVNPTLRVALYDSANKLQISPSIPGDGVSAARPLIAAILKYGFNGSTWDRWRNNTEVTVLPSATRTASGVSSDQTNHNAKGGIVHLRVTAVSGTFAAGEGLSIRVDAKDPVSGTYHRITEFIGPYTSPGHWILVCYAGATDVAGSFEGRNDVPIPRTWRVRYEITGTTPSFTFSVAVQYIV